MIGKRKFRENENTYFRLQFLAASVEIDNPARQAVANAMARSRNVEALETLIRSCLIRDRGSSINSSHGPTVFGSSGLGRMWTFAVRRLMKVKYRDLKDLNRQRL